MIDQPGDFVQENLDLVELEQSLRASAEIYGITNMRGLQELISAFIAGNITLDIDDKAIYRRRDFENDTQRFQAFWTFVNLLRSDNKSLDEESHNLLKIQYRNGLKVPPRELSLIKGAGINLANQLIYLSDVKDKPEIVFFNALLVLNMIKSDSLNEEAKRKLAILILYIFVPIIRLYEKADLLGDLQDAALEFLNPELTTFAQKNKREHLNIDFDPKLLKLNAIQEWLMNCMRSISNEIKGSNRIKSNMSVALKNIEGNDPTDIIAFKYAIEGKDKDSLLKIVELLKSNGVIVDLCWDTFINPMPGDPNYKVLNLRTRIPVVFIEADGQKTEHYLPAEIRLGLENFDHSHPQYKMRVQVMGRLTEKGEDITTVASYLQSQLSIAMGFQDEIETQVREDFEKLMDKTDKTIFLFTGRANNVLLIPRFNYSDEQYKIEVAKQADVFSKQVMFNGSGNGTYLVERRIGGKSVISIVVVYADDFDHYVIIDGEAKYDENGQFKFNNGDRVEAIRGLDDRRVIMTINELLNSIAEAKSPNDIPFQEIFDTYVVDRITILDIWMNLKGINEKLDFHTLNRARTQEEYDEYQDLKDRHSKFVKYIKRTIIRNEDLKPLLTGNINEVSGKKKDLRQLVSHVTSSKLGTQIEGIANLEEIIPIIFNLDDYFGQSINKQTLSAFSDVLKKFSNNTVWPELKIYNILNTLIIHYFSNPKKYAKAIEFGLAGGFKVFPIVNDAYPFLKKALVIKKELLFNLFQDRRKDIDYEKIGEIFPNISKIQIITWYSKLKAYGRAIEMYIDMKAKIERGEHDEEDKFNKNHSNEGEKESKEDKLKRIEERLGELNSEREGVLDDILSKTQTEQ